MPPPLPSELKFLQPSDFYEKIFSSIENSTHRTKLIMKVFRNTGHCLKTLRIVGVRKTVVEKVTKPSYFARQETQEMKKKKVFQIFHLPKTIQFANQIDGLEYLFYYLPNACWKFDLSYDNTLRRSINDKRTFL